MPYSEFDTPWVEDPGESPGTALYKPDGARLYETDDEGLLHKIIQLNDIPRLKQYLSAYSPNFETRDSAYQSFRDEICQFTPMMSLSR